MRTKTLLIAAAALVAGIISSNAQVYSQNIVGYVNVVTPANQLALLANPLDNGTNTLTSLFPNGSVDNGSTIQIWNGAGYSGSTKTPVGWSVNFVIPPGIGFFFKDANAKTNAFVGNVVVTPGATNTYAFTNNILELVGSPIPFQDTLTGTNLNLKLVSGSTLQVWSGTGFNGTTKTPVGWSVNYTITPGQGFFVKNTGITTNWNETLPSP